MGEGEHDAHTIASRVTRSIHPCRLRFAGTLKDAFELYTSQFLRIHRSTIVNIEKVRELQPYFHGEYVVVLRDGARLKLSRTHRDKLAKLLGLSAAE